MMIENTLPNNPYLFLKEDSLSIQCGKQPQQIDLKSIKKIHISKRKPGQLSGLLGQLLFIRDTDYYLNIETVDHHSFKIRINPVERFFCIKLVGILRRQLQSKQLSF